MKRASLPYLIAFVIAGVPAMAAGTPCERLTEMTIPGVQIRSAMMAQAGAASLGLPPFCRIFAVARPVPDSEIEFEVWIPSASNWNGKFLGVGNGGYSGSLNSNAMAQALKQGYATASHNTGHQGDDLRFGQGHPEKVVDYAQRAVHVMTENAKLLIRVHTGRHADRNYFSGCSAGGHQAIVEAQKYPDDYDGIVAGAPANNRIRQTFGFLWFWMAMHKDDGTPLLRGDQLPQVTKAVVDACDTVDGLKDGIIEDPRRCASVVDLKKILPDPAQADAVRKVWAGLKSPKTGARIFAGFPMGSEDIGGQSWRQYLLDPREPMRVELFRYFLFHDPNWDFRTVDWDRDLAFADRHLGFMNATNSDLSAFSKHGGKLLLYAGWSDPIVPPEDTVSYYESLVKAAPAGQAFARLFLAPGMGHCGGGPGPNQFDSVKALDEWVTKNTPPERMVAKHAASGRTRPLCAYPKVAKYRGPGSQDDAANFTCVVAVH
jgi:feruloyl esterase